MSALLLLSLTGCTTHSSNSLDRSRALETLRLDPSATRAAVASIRTGRFESPCPEFETSDYRALRRAGFIEYSASSLGEMREARITARGQEVFGAAGATSLPEKGCSLMAWKVPLAKREIVSITGIVLDGNSAIVEYRWRFVPTPAGAPIGGALYARDAVGSTIAESAADNRGSTMPLGDQPGRAQLLLYDDGWRVVRVTH